MVVHVVITNTIMSSTLYLGLQQKTYHKNGKKKSVAKVLKNGNSKKVVRPQFMKDEQKINHFFLPQKKPKLESEPKLTLEVAVDDNVESNQALRPEKENETNSSVSTVGFLKMSPYRNNHNFSSLNQCARTKPSSSIESQQNGIVKSKLLDHSYSSEVIEKKYKSTKPVEKKLTECYPVRRSGRKTISVIKKEKENRLIDAVLSNQEDGMEVVEFTSKGRGVVATRKFSRNEFVVEYAGDLIEWSEAKQRERFYATNPAIGCYMYYFSAKGRNFCIDATTESGKLGRLLNHSKKNPNCYTKLVWVPGTKSGAEEPHLVILAKRDLDKGEELTYDYGDRDKAAVEVHPWLKS